MRTLQTYVPAGAFGGEHRDDRAAAAGVFLSVLAHLLAVAAFTLLWSTPGHLRQTDMISVAMVEPGPAPKPAQEPVANAPVALKAEAAPVVQETKPAPPRERPEPVRKVEEEEPDGTRESVPEKTVVIHNDVAVAPQSGEDAADLVAGRPDVEERPKGREDGQETVTYAAPAASPYAGPEPGAAGGGAEAGLESLRYEYAMRLRELIERYVHYPVFARKARIEGTCTVVCRMKSTGEVLGVDVERSTGHDVLDRAALSAVRDAGSFPPVPYIRGEDEVNVSVPVNFSLGGR